MSVVTVDTTSTLDSILAFAGPLVGVAVGAWGSWRVAQARDKKAERAEVARALADYMAAAELVAVELQSFPEDSWLERKVDRVFPKQRRVGSLVQRLLERMVFGRRHDDLRREYQQARAQVVLVAPIMVIGLVLRIEDFFGEWQNVRGPEMQRRWGLLRDELRLVAQTTVDEQRGRPYRAGEPPINAAPRPPTRRQRLTRSVRERLVWWQAD